MLAGSVSNRRVESSSCALEHHMPLESAAWLMELSVVALPAAWLMAPLPMVSCFMESLALWAVLVMAAWLVLLLLMVSCDIELEVCATAAEAARPQARTVVTKSLDMGDSGKNGAGLVRPAGYRGKHRGAPMPGVHGFDAWIFRRQKRNLPE
jgi:hypothetical protein